MTDEERIKEVIAQADKVLARKPDVVDVIEYKLAGTGAAPLPFTSVIKDTPTKPHWGDGVVAQEVKHINEGQKYRIVIERSAVKNTDGFKVEANGDDLEAVEKDIKGMYAFAKNETAPEVGE